ncbi:MAG TPA: tRNA-binding protein [Gammaproteobacteria bacterium]|nr:tRNA-binding protein [Gammaproteobacteria bacterium]|tara:strand:+ start:7639 stop:8016 length:378 start_codon:yes stop_codon:yes gene_type:complete
MIQRRRTTLENEIKPTISWADFERLDMRVGTVRRAEAFPEAHKPAIKLWLWFGEAIGELKTSAQITDHYTPDKLIGRQLIAVVNFPPKQIGPFMSQCLITGVIGDDQDITLLRPDFVVQDGQKIG